MNKAKKAGMWMVLVVVFLLIINFSYAQAWNIGIVDSGSGYTSIDLDNSGNPHISYYDGMIGVLKYAKYVGSGGNCGSNYCGSNQWQCTTIGSAGAGRTSIAVDKNNIPHISYFSGNLKYAKYVGTGGNCGSNQWQCTSLIGAVGPSGISLASIAIDNNNIPHISYFDSSGDPSISGMKYAKYVGTGGNCGSNQWQCTNIETAGAKGYDNSIDVDSNNNPHIVYRDQDSFDLKYAKYVGTGGNCGTNNAWSCSYIDTSGTSFENLVGYHNSIKLYNNVPHVSYSAGALKYAKYVGSGGNCGTNNAWQCSIIDFSASLYTSLDLDSSGNPHISYIDPTDPINIKLKYAKYVGSGGNCDNPQWQCTQIDSVSSTPSSTWYTSIAVNRNTNEVHISYSTTGVTNYYLKHTYTYPCIPPAEICDGIDSNCGSFDTDVCSYKIYYLGGGSDPSLEWTGTEYGVMVIDAGNMKFKKVSSTGNILTTPIANSAWSNSFIWNPDRSGYAAAYTIGGEARTKILSQGGVGGTENLIATKGESPSAAWNSLNSEYGIVYDTNDDIYFAKLDETGAKKAGTEKLILPFATTPYSTNYFLGKMIYNPEKQVYAFIHTDLRYLLREAKITIIDKDGNILVNKLIKDGYYNSVDVVWTGTEYGAIIMDMDSHKSYFARLDENGGLIAGSEKETPGAEDLYWTGSYYVIAYTKSTGSGNYVFLKRIDAQGNQIGVDLMMKGNLLGLIAGNPVTYSGSSVTSAGSDIGVAFYGNGNVYLSILGCCDNIDNDGYSTCDAIPDCADSNPHIYPGNTNTYCDCDLTDGFDKGTAEICGNGIDEDCNGADLVCVCSDNDGDGYLSNTCGGNDCDDADANVNPGKTEICDGADNDCNPATQDGSGETAPPNQEQRGVCEGSLKTCEGTAGWQNDYSGIAGYEAVETLCDGLDNDCDGEADEGCDDDDDNYCDSSMTVSGSPATCTNGGNDCDDLNALKNPGSPDICYDCNPITQCSRTILLSIPKIANVYKAKIWVQAVDVTNFAVDVNDDGTAEYTNSENIFSDVLNLQKAVNDSVRSCNALLYQVCTIPVKIISDSGILSISKIDVEYTNYYWDTSLMPEATTYRARITAQEAKPFCGNGILEVYEGCDDGNAVTGDGCTNLCKLEYCGDNICSAGETCDIDSCCSGMITDLTTESNCGSCGKACTEGKICDGGSCVCNVGLTECGGICIDVSSDPNNCGTCGNVCTGGKLCSNGACECLPGLFECAGTCTDTTSDSSNCGSCGKVCNAGEVCYQNQCLSDIFSCSLKTACETWETELFSMYSDSNSHVGTSSYYLNKVCCGKPGMTTSATDCTGADDVFIISKFQQDDSHVSTSDLHDYDVCMNVDSGALSCDIMPGTMGVCTTGSCVATFYSSDDSHVAACPVYTIMPFPDTLCCAYVPAAVAAACGDGACDVGEDCSSCEADCGTCPPVCGNGVVEAGEICDDGNTADCDGCIGDCSRYDKVCGDGILECGESCDDLNTAPRDGCSSSCTIEPEFLDIFMMTPKKIYSVGETVQLTG